ncbi:hypothetical protein HanPSC8_Chr10g0436061 [Helianthus annuus]|nr:hypothetical protein HanPSC8_Chr10g0436061 [Helianthus annuus]
MTYHLLLNLLEVLIRQGLNIKIIVKPVFNPWTNRHFSIRKYFLNRHRHNMSTLMPNSEECMGRFISRKHYFLYLLRNISGNIVIGGEGRGGVGGDGSRRREEAVMGFLEKVKRLELWTIQDGIE